MKFKSAYRYGKTVEQLMLLKGDPILKLACPSQSRKEQIIQIAKDNNIYDESFEKRIKVGMGH